MRVETTMNGRRVAVVGVAVLLAAAVGCEQGKREQRAPTPLDLTTVGSNSGDVRFEGTPPAGTTVQLASAKDCAAQHSGPIVADDVLVRDGKVQNALVYVKEGLGDRVFAVPTEPVVVDQKGCMFAPRISAVQVGQPLKFLNNDPLAHNVRGVSARTSGWNFNLGVQGASRTVEVDQSDPTIELKCDIHPWMKAYVGVFDHPYAVLSGADGSFKLDKLPPGDYVVAAWHERFGARTANVSVAAREAKRIDFTFAP